MANDPIILYTNFRSLDSGKPKAGFANAQLFFGTTENDQHPGVFSIYIGNRSHVSALL